MNAIWDIDMVPHRPVLRHIFEPVSISICDAPLLHFIFIHRPNEWLLFHPPGTPRCVCVSGCQSHRSHVKLWLLFVREPVNQWEANHCRCAPTWHQKRERLQAGSICLCPPSRGCISLFWDIHARIPHSYSGSPRAANGFPFVARPFCFSCCCETRTDYSALVYSHEEE